MLLEAITQHNDKDVFTDSHLVELLKDVDSLDRYLHGVTTEAAYLDRCNKVLMELGIDLESTEGPQP